MLVASTTRRESETLFCGDSLEVEASLNERMSGWVVADEFFGILSAA
jgi:hypothetical protein